MNWIGIIGFGIIFGIFEYQNEKKKIQYKKKKKQKKIKKIELEDTFKTTKKQKLEK